MQPYWLLLQTKSREEQRAQQHLQNQGCRTFCPQIQVEKISRGKRQIAIEPLFPSYLFVQVQDEQGLHTTFTSIRSTRGVSKIIRFGEEYTKIPQELVESIQERINQSEKPVNTNMPQKGDTVTINKGPFRGMEAIYHQADGQMRSMVFINILHQQATIVIENKNLAV